MKASSSKTPAAFYFPLIVTILLIALPGAPLSQKAAMPDGKCPADMAWVEAGGFCMDRYEFPNIKGKEPVRDVTFNVAMKLCQSRGKKVPSREQFLAACEGAKKERFVYGPSFVPGKCRSGLTWVDGPAPAGSYPGCVRDDIFDLNGNVWEWLGEKNETGRKFIAGGAWNTESDQANCQDNIRIYNVVIAPNVGVRCISIPAK